MMRALLAVALVATVFSVHIRVHTGSFDLEAFRNAELAKHNELRALHGASALTLSGSLNSAAQAYAQQIAASHQMQHSPQAKSGQYGENLYWGWGWPTLNYELGTASTDWYSEVQYYNYATGKSNDPTQAVGHFTAMIWAAVTEVGFGYAATEEDGGQAVYIVANYSPTPNVIGNYQANVHPKSA